MATPGWENQYTYENKERGESKESGECFSRQLEKEYHNYDTRVDGRENVDCYHDVIPQISW